MRQSATTAIDDVADEEVAILEAFPDVGAPVRRVALAETLDDTDDYPPHERALLDRDAIEEVGHENVPEDGERVVYRRFAMTKSGDHLLRRVREGGDTDTEPDPVAPSRSTLSQSWDKRAPWTELAEHIDRLLEETQSVERFAMDDGRHDWGVRVVLAREDTDQQVTVEFNPQQWHNASGRHEFYKRYRNAFRERLDIDDRAFGVLQARWLAEYTDS